MSTTIGTIVLDIKADTAKLVNGMAKAERSISKSVDRMKKTVLTLVSAYTALQAAMGMKDFITDATAVAAKFEQIGAILKVVTGSATEARNAMQWITDFTKNTPYQLEQVTEAFVKLKAYGLDAQKDLRVLGDTASAMGKPLMQAVEAIADAVNGEFERLKEFGIKARQQGNQVAFQWADATGKTKHIVIENNNAIIESTLKAIWNSKYAGAMQEQSKTWAGMLSNLRDNYTIFQKSIMDGGLYDYLKAVLSTILKRSKEVFSTSAEHVKTWVNIGIKAINKLIESVGFLYDAFTGIRVVLKTIELGFDYLVKGIVKAFNTATEYINKLIDLYNSMPERLRGEKISKYALRDESIVDKWIEEDKRALESLVNSITKGREYSKQFVEDVNKEFEKIKNTIDDGKNNPKTSLKGAIEGAFKTFGTESKKAKKIAKESIKYIETTVDQATKNIYQSFEDNFFDAITGKFKNFKDFLKNLFNDILWSVINPFAKQMSQSLATSTTNLLGLQTPAQQAQLQAFVQTLPTQLIQAGWKTITKDGKTFYVSKSGEKVSVENGQIQAYTAGGELTSLANLATLPSNVKTAFNIIKSPTQLLYLPAQQAGQIAGWAYKMPYVGQYAGDFFSGSAAFLSGGNIAGMSTAAKLGGYTTAAVGGYLFGKLGDKLFGADTYAGTGGATAATIGAMIGGLPGAVIGAVLGSVLGGLFGKTKVVGTATGIDIFDEATADYVAGQYWGRTDYKKKSWFKSKKWSKWKYKEFDEEAIKAIKRVIATFDYLYAQMYDVDKKLQVTGGRFSSIDAFLSGSVVKAFLDEATPADLDYVYNAWSKYADSVNKKVYEVFTEKIQSYLQYMRNWKFDVLAKSDETEALKYKAEYLQDDFEKLAKLLGITGVSVENFAQKYEEAVKSNLTPEEIDKWQQLGEALKAATDAAQAYQKAILAEYNAQSKYKEYMLKLNEQLQAEVKQQIQATYTTLLNMFTNLKQQAQAFIDGWFASGYPADVSYEFYASRYNELKREFESALSLGDTASMQNAFNALQTVATNLKTAAINLGDPDLLDKVLGAVYNDFNNYMDLLSNAEEVVSVKIIGSDIDIAQNETLEKLSNAIDEYNKTIAEQLGVSSKLTLDSFWTDRSLMTPADVKAFAEILHPKTLEELDKWINIFGNIRWEGLDYLSTLNDTDKQRAVDLLQQVLGDAVTINKKTLEGGFYNWYSNNINLDELTGIAVGADLEQVRQDYSDYLKSINKSYTSLIDTIVSKVDYQEAVNNTDYVFDEMLNAFKQLIEERDYLLTADELKNLYKNFKYTDESGNKYKFAQDWWDMVSSFIGATSAISFIEIPITEAANLQNEGKNITDAFNIYDIKLPKFADGGIVTSPTIGLIGEAGYPEAVIPLTSDYKLKTEIDLSPIVTELREIKEENRAMREKLVRMERVLSRNEGENGLRMEVAS